MAFTRQLGGPDVVVEVDETFWGNKGKKPKGARGWRHKERVFSLVERGGEVRSYHVPTVAAKTLRPIVREQIDQDTAMMADHFSSCMETDSDFVSNEVVKHCKGEYVRGQIHTSTVSNYLSIEGKRLLYRDSSL